MAKLFVLFLVFVAVMVPVAFFTFSGGGKKGDVRRKKKDASRSGTDACPTVYLLTKIPAAVLEMAGVGESCDKCFPSDRIKLAEALLFANLKLRTATVYCTQIFLSLFLGGFFALFAAAAVSRENAMTIPLAGVFGVFVGCVLPRTAIANLVQTRRAQMLAAIPYSIDLITSALRGGLDFSAAIRFYVKIAASGPLTDEYAKMLREMELGVIRTEAIQNMANRIQIKEFSAFVAAVILGTELGSPMAETMEIQGEEMRRTRFAIAENKAQRAPSLMLLPMALFIMPAVFIIILTPVFLKMGESGISLF